MGDLVSKPDFIKAANLKKLHLEKAAGPLMKLTGIHRLNQMYEHLQQLDGIEFIDALLKELQIEVEFDESELSKIPAKGPFITISNHPFGLLDGLILIKLVAARRPDFKVMANFMLNQVEPVADFFIPVNPFKNEKGPWANMTGMKKCLMHLQEGLPLGIFPAGEVSTLSPTWRGITDRPWQGTALKLIQRSEVPVIPFYFQGQNSALFHLVGLIHPMLRTVALPSEMLKKKNANIRVRVGQPISVREQKDFEDTERFGRYMKARTYSLGSALKVNPFFRKRTLIYEEGEPIAEETPSELIETEIEKIRPYALLLSQQEFEIYTAQARDIPHVLQEIGRLREITFREVNEGTLQSRDLDEYDLYYLHLFLWDKEAKKIAGAYRIGLGNSIFEQYGKNGFYLSSLFRIKDEFSIYLRRAIELGRSFVLSDYQRKRLPLYLLWKGIHTLIENSEEHRYIIGPVSISNHYSKLSKRFMVAFIKKFYFDEDLAKHIKPRKRFRSKLTDGHLSDLLEDMPNDLKKVDKVIADMEPAHFRLPVLLKKYIRQNARIIGFNIDPKFNNALDGLMILDMKDLPDETTESMTR
jgi:putative hemolysin